MRSFRACIAPQHVQPRSVGNNLDRNRVAARLVEVDNVLGVVERQLHHRLVVLIDLNCHLVIGIRRRFHASHLYRRRRRLTQYDQPSHDDGKEMTTGRRRLSDMLTSPIDRAAGATRSPGREL